MKEKEPAKETRKEREDRLFRESLSTPRAGFSFDQELTLLPIEREGLNLSEIRWMRPDELRLHPLNERYFKEESQEYFEKLTQDVRNRGILVPLIAKPDGTVLAGHNRLKIALELKIERIPVQTVLCGLDGEAEKEFLIKDNLLRRHLSAEEKRRLILELYGVEIEDLQKGGDRKSEKAKIKVHVNFDQDAKTLPEKIEKETGIKAGTAKRIIADIRREKKKPEILKKQKELSPKETKRKEKLSLQLRSLTEIESTLERKLEKLREEKRAVMKELKSLGQMDLF